MKITKANYLISAVNSKGYPKEEYPNFMFIGRSNVGKSSFINALTGRKNLAYTSSKPGKTQTLNFYNINDAIFFVDVPGYGYAKQLVQNRLAFGDMIEDYFENSQLLKVITYPILIGHSNIGGIIGTMAGGLIKDSQVQMLYNEGIPFSGGF